MQPTNFFFLFQTMDEEIARDLTSHEGQKVHSYSLKFKITAIEFAEIHGSRAAEKLLMEKEYCNGEPIKRKS